MEKLVAKVLSYQLLVGAGALVLIAVAIAGIGGLKLNASYTAYFEENFPILNQHRLLQKQFSISDGLFVALVFDSGEIFDQSSLRTLSKVTNAVESLDFVVTTKSVLDLHSSIESDFDDLDAELFGLDEGFTGRPKEILIDQEAVKRDPRGARLLYSDSGRSLGIDITVNLPESLPAQDLIATMETIRAAVSQGIQDSGGRATARYSGPLLLNEAYVTVIRHDLKVFLPAMVLSIGFVLSFLFGNWRIAGVVYLIAAAAVLGAFGFGGWLNFELAAIVAFAPVMIASIAIAGCVHLISSYHSELAAGCEAKTALSTALSENLTPLTLTTFTTALGFFALTFSPSPPIRIVGLLVAAGVVLSWVFIVSLLPILLPYTSSKPKRTDWLRDKLIKLSSHSQLKRRNILLLGCLILLIAVPLASQNKINDNVFTYFPHEHSFQQDAQFLDESFSGVNPLVYSISASNPFGIFDHQILSAAADFQRWINRQSLVKKSLGIANFKDTTGITFLENNLALNRYRELAKLHSPTGLGLERLVDENYQHLAIHAYLTSVDADSLLQFNRRALEWFSQNYPAFEIRSGGTSLMFAYLGQHNATSMIKALLIALVFISFLCAIVLKKFNGLWLGILCNLFPIVAVYALWALVDGTVSIGGAVVIGMILGIVVDDTLYLMTSYRRAKLSGSKEPVTDAIAEVGPALLITSITLFVGLATGLLSDFRPINVMSGLSMAIIILAVFIDVVLLSIALAERKTT
ncbi:MAG: MMPL family transporter [Pseudomonadota bacterium]